MDNPPFPHRLRLVAALGAMALAFPDPPSARPLLAVLDPVDLSQARSLPPAGEALRNAAREAERFRLLSGPETEAKLREFKWNAGRPCHEFQCAFEAGNVLMAEYVLFGTLTPLDGLHAYSFNVLDTRSGRVVESAVGHASRNPEDPGADPSLAHLAAFASALDPSRYDGGPKAGQGLIAVLDGNPESPESRVLTDRIGTHVHGFRTHDLMGQTELEELADAMGISLASLAASDSGLLLLGARLNIDCLVRSKLERGPRGQRLELALFDIAGKRRVRSWTSNTTGDFGEILRFESRFFKTLKDWPAGAGGGSGEGPVAAQGGTRWGRTLLALAGITTAGGLGAMAYASHRRADEAYRRAESSLGPAAGDWKRRTETADRSTLIFGGLAALALGGSITLWTF